MIKNVMKVAPGLGEASAALGNIVDAWKQYKITAEVEQTKRAAIQANRDTSVKMIEENSAILKTYLEGMFRERAGIIGGMFDRLDRAVADGNPQLASDAIAAIVAVSRESPLAGARELLGSMRDPSVKSIEI